MKSTFRPKRACLQPSSPRAVREQPDGRHGHEDFTIVTREEMPDPLQHLDIDPWPSALWRHFAAGGRVGIVTIMTIAPSASGRRIGLPGGLLGAPRRTAVSAKRWRSRRWAAVSAWRSGSDWPDVVRPSIVPTPRRPFVVWRSRGHRHRPRGGSCQPVGRSSPSVVALRTRITWPRLPPPGCQALPHAPAVGAEPTTPRPQTGRRLIARPARSAGNSRDGRHESHFERRVIHQTAGRGRTANSVEGFGSQGGQRYRSPWTSGIRPRRRRPDAAGSIDRRQKEVAVFGLCQSEAIPSGCPATADRCRNRQRADGRPARPSIVAEKTGWQPDPLESQPAFLRGMRVREHVALLRQASPGKVGCLPPWRGPPPGCCPWTMAKRL